MYITNGTAYVELSSLAERESAVIKLSRIGGSWGLEVVLPPVDGDPQWRAFATVFPDIGELEAHSWHLARWLAAFRPARPGEAVRRPDLY